MNSLKSVKVITLVFLLAQFVVGGQYKVDQNLIDGSFKTIMEAVKAAKAAKDPNPEIIIMDLGTYKEQVTIDSMTNVTLRSDKPSSSKKPVIQYRDTLDTQPRTTEESTKSDLPNSFDFNGALRILFCRGVTLEGITIDGGSPFVYGYDAVWFNAKTNQKSPQNGGNAALHLTVTGDAKIRYCEFKNAFYGINVKDRNIGGIFANVNPSDLDSLKIVPNSGFGKTGNHLIEYCRFDKNSYGMFFESAWDLGSTMRYNLFYENYHTSAVEAKLKNITDGGNEPGGAFFFKDNMLSPLAIYNNTFYHNIMVFGGHWRAGSQHLIFNNIYGTPNKYANNYMAMDKVFGNRMHNCVYAVQEQALGNAQPNFDQQFDKDLNEMAFTDTIMSYQPQFPTGDVQSQNFTVIGTFSDGTTFSRAFSGKVPGGLIVSTKAPVGFPKSANIRWLETKFKNTTNPDDPNFLVPDWDDSLVNLYVKGQGWDGADVRNVDGTIADLGAIPFSGSYPATETVIKPSFPIILDGSSATLMFDVANLSGTLNNPVIKYFTWINNIMNPKDSSVWSSNVTPIPSTDIYNLTVPSQKISVGGNTITISLPSGLKPGAYAFVEMTIEGTDASGNKVTSVVGFLPYRKLDYSFKVEVWPVSGGTGPLKQVKVGEPVTLHITPMDKSSIFKSDVSPVDVKLQSLFPLLFASKDTVFTLDTVKGGGTTITAPVIFTKVPVTTNGYDRVAVNGIHTGTGTESGASFGGISDTIKVLPGDPAKITFYDPSSGSVAPISPGFPKDITVNVTDKYGNRISAPTNVTLSCTETKIADIYPNPAVDNNKTTNDSGFATFQVMVTDSGNFNDIFHLKAILVANNAFDTLTMRVDKPRNRLWVYYIDTTKFVQDEELRGQAGDVLPIYIHVSTDGVVVTDSITNLKFDVSTSKPNIVFLASATDTTPTNSFIIKDGRAKIWVKGTGVVSNGDITVTADGIRPGYKENIYFEVSAYPVDYANYYSSNGYGKVDSIDIYFKKEITQAMIPDSVALCWPEETNKKMIIGKNQWVLSSDSKHISLKLTAPFPEAITTYGSSQKLVTTYWNDPVATSVPTQTVKINVNDKVGPLLMSGILTERPSYNSTGNDTIKITLSEDVQITPTNTLKGQSLTLRKLGGGSFQLNILQADKVGDTITLIVENAGINSPKEGDSLQITPTGPTVDLYGNKANIDNRPVVLTLKGIPAELDTACYYYDDDGNGVVDAATIKFKKNVKIDVISMTFTWGTNKANSIQGAKLSYTTDSSNVRVNLEGAFNNILKTDGTMNIEVQFLNFEGKPTSRPQEVKDKAAPVLTKAEYFPGSAKMDGSAPDKDTLYLEFSEPVSGFSTLTKEPYVFWNSGNKYSMVLDTINHSTNKYRYAVDSILNILYPVNGDSVQIQWAIATVSDIYSNFQDTSTNRKVPMKVNPPKYDLIVKSGPNPFNPDNQKFTIYIDPVVKDLSQIIVNVDMTIHDQLGNVVYKASKILDKKDYKQVGGKALVKYGEWNGLNLNGRKVGSGTYVAIIKKKDLNPTSADYKRTIALDPVMIGVRR